MEKPYEALYENLFQKFAGDFLELGPKLAKLGMKAASFNGKEMEKIKKQFYAELPHYGPTKKNAYWKRFVLDIVEHYLIEHIVDLPARDQSLIRPPFTFDEVTKTWTGDVYRDSDLEPLSDDSDLADTPETPDIVDLRDSPQDIVDLTVDSPETPVPIVRKRASTPDMPIVRVQADTPARTSSTRSSRSRSPRSSRSRSPRSSRSRSNSFTEHRRIKGPLEARNSYFGNLELDNEIQPAFHESFQPVWNRMTRKQKTEWRRAMAQDDEGRTYREQIVLEIPNPKKSRRK